MNDNYKEALHQMIEHDSEKTFTFFFKDGKEVETIEEFQAALWERMTFGFVDRRVVVDKFYHVKEQRFLLEASRRVGHPMFQDVCMDVSVFGRDITLRASDAVRVLLMGDCTCNAPGKFFML
jgi:hypothetical protein